MTWEALNSLTGESAAKGIFLTLVAGVGGAIVRTFMAKAKSTEATAEHANANSEATDSLFEHYRKELSDLRATVQDLGDRLSATEKKAAKVEALYKQSAAGERRYRQAFALLIQQHSRLMAIARTMIEAELLEEVETSVTNLLMELAKPLDTPAFDEEVEEERKKDESNLDGTINWTG